MSVGTASEVSFLNGALGLIPTQRITLASWVASLAGTGSDPNANWCAVYYDRQRKSLLRRYKWNFATFQEDLVEESVTGYQLTGFGTQFRLPTNFIRLAAPPSGGTALTTGGVADRWAIRGGYLRSDYSEVTLLFVRDIDDPAEWDELFYNAFQHILAGILARSIAHNDVRANELGQIAISLLQAEAAAIESQEETLQPITVDDLLWGRGGRDSFGWHRNWWPTP